MRFLFSTLSAALIALAWTSPSQADIASFSGSSGNLEASALFNLTGTTLTVTLTNTSTVETTNPGSVLTGVFFNVNSPSTLTPSSAALNGSSVIDGTITNPGDGWGYATGVSAQGFNSAISASGAVTNLGQSNFSGTSNNLDGANYGLVSSPTTSSSGSTGFRSQGPYINNSVVFTLTASSDFSLSQLGSNVVFQYGTSLTETHFGAVPEPSTMAIAGLGSLGFIGYGLRRRLKK